MNSNKTKINSIFLIFLFLVSIFSVINVTNSTGQNVPIAGAVSNTYNYTLSPQASYVITLYNNQSVNTVQNFQQLLQLNLTQLNISNIGGIRFSDFNENMLYAWLESYNSTTGLANIWVNLGNDIIPANGQTQIYMYYSPSLNFDGIYWGEAPQLSQTYAQYDNGNNVFSYYWNFAGTSLPNGLTVGRAGGSYSVNNGITITGSLSGVEIISTSNPINPQTNILDMYGYLTGTGQTGATYELSSSTNSNSPIYIIYVSSANTYSLINYNSGYGPNITITISGSQNSDSIWSIWASSSGSYASYNYGTPVFNNNTFASSTSMYGNLMSAGNTVYANWLRVRTYPPNGIMPNVINITPLQIINNYAVIPLNSIVNISSSNTINATWYVNNAVVSTNTTYYTTTFSQPGIYSIYYTNTTYGQSNYLSITVYDPSTIVSLAQSYINASEMTYFTGMYSYSLMFNIIVPNWITAINVSLTSTLSNGNTIQPITVGWVFQQYVNGSFINLTGSTVTVQQATNYTFPINMQLTYQGVYTNTYAITFYPLSNSTSDIQNITYLGIPVDQYDYVIDYMYFGIRYTNATGSTIENDNLYTIMSAFQSPTQFGNLTVMESGLPSGTSWSVTMTNNGNVFTSTTNSILIQLPYNATFTFTVSSSNSLYTPSPSSFTVNTAIFNLSPSITKSVTFSYQIQAPFIIINEQPDDAGLMDQYNINISYLYNPNNLDPSLITPTYINIQSNTNGYWNNQLSLSWLWSNYTLYLYNISYPLTVQNILINIMPSNGKIANIINSTYPTMGTSTIVLPSSISGGGTVGFKFQFPYWIKFTPNGLYNNAGVWSATIYSVNGTIISQSNLSAKSLTQSTTGNSSITFGVFNGTYNYTITPPLNYYATANSSGQINISGSNITINVIFSPLPITVQTWVAGFMPGETVWINVTGTTLYGYPYSTGTNFTVTNYYSTYGNNLTLYAGLYNFTFAFTQNFGNYTNINGSYWATLNYSTYTYTITQYTFNNQTLSGSFLIQYGGGGLSFTANLQEYTVTIITNLPNSPSILQYSFINSNSTLAGIAQYNPSGVTGNTVTVQVPQGIYSITLSINTGFYPYVPVVNTQATIVENIYQNTVIYYNFTYIGVNYTIVIQSLPTFIGPYSYSLYLNGTLYSNVALNYTTSGTVLSQSYNIVLNLPPATFTGTFVQYSQFYIPTTTTFTLAYGSNSNTTTITLQTNYTPVTLQISGFVGKYNLNIYIQNQSTPIITLNDNSPVQVVNLAPFITYTYAGTDQNIPPDQANGSFYISYANQTVYIAFMPTLQTTIYVIETGLPTGVQWSATITVTYTIYIIQPRNINTAQNTVVETNSSTGIAIGFTIPYPSNFTITIQNVSYGSTYVPSPNTIIGSVNLSGITSSPYYVAFSAYQTLPTQPPTTGNASYLPPVNNALNSILPFSASVFWIVIYVLFIIGLMGYIAYKTGNTMATIITGGALVAVGYIMNVIPGWIIAFLFAIAIATILYEMFLKGDEGGGG